METVIPPPDCAAPSAKTGRPMGANGIRAQAARQAKQAIAALAAVARDTNAPAADRVSAAQTILAHAYPKEIA